LLETLISLILTFIKNKITQEILSSTVCAKKPYQCYN